MEVLDTYKDLLLETYETIDNNQMKRIADLISESSKVHVYGIEKTALVARRFRRNFMKLGVNIQQITDISTMEISEMLMDEDTLAIGFSIVAEDGSDPVMEAIVSDKAKGAKTIMISSNPNIISYEACDELIFIKENENRDIRYSISPKFPMFIFRCNGLWERIQF